LVGLVFAFNAAAQNEPAEHHTATRLGNPATRFAAPLNSLDDLRARFRDFSLRPDFAEVLHQWGWQGNLDDFFSAGLTNPVVEWEIKVGNDMPFMASRDGGKPVCLRNVTWAGKEPVKAYAFTFSSNDRNYRCIIPKPCSNFYVVDLGPVPRWGLALDCNVPGQVVMGRTVEVCVNLHNTGNMDESLARVVLPIPAGATVTATTDGGIVTNNSVQWHVANLAANANKQLCTELTAQAVGTLEFQPIASGTSPAQVQSACNMEVTGIAALRFEKGDDPDPVAIGTTTTYTVRVTNQGTADAGNVQVVVAIAPELIPVSTSEGTIDGQNVTLPLVPQLAAKQTVTYKITAKGVTAGNAITKFTLSSDILRSSIFAEESTTVY
jgi:uncharacterized repeat protein (TIGR01451 family)